MVLVVQYRGGGGGGVSRKVAKGGEKSKFWVFREGKALMREVHFLGGLGACPPRKF